MDSLDEQLIEKYIAGECSDVEMEQIFRWLNASEANRKEWLKLRMVTARNNFVHFSDSEHISRSYKELRKEQLARERLEQEITRKIIRRFMRYAASILLLIGLFVVSYQYVANWRHPKMMVVAVSGTEPVRKILLNDSTCVWLSAGSQIEYPEKFDKNERNVSVEGKVYFEVSKDTKRPFLVKTETYTVKVLGTSFEVNSSKYRELSDVTLVEGSVEILDKNMMPLCQLQPGQQFKINKTNNLFGLHEVNAEIYASWHDGKLEFDGLTLAEIAKVLERHYNVRIILDKGIAKDKKLVGSLSFQKDIHEMMKTIELVVPIKYSVQTDTIVHILSK